MALAALVPSGRRLLLLEGGYDLDALADCTGAVLSALVAAVPSAAGTLLDVTYRPWPTTLAAAWVRAGGAAVAGERMLLWQAVRQVELMTGMPGPVRAMDEALSAVGRER